MISHSDDKSQVGPKRQFGLEMAGDFAAPLGDMLFGAPEKVHTSAARCVVNFASKNICPY